MDVGKHNNEMEVDMEKFTLKDWDDAIEKNKQVKKAVFDIESF